MIAMPRRRPARPAASETSPTGAAPRASGRCLRCAGPLRTYLRSGVQIEQCEDCRGIFLDAGELERLIDAEGGGWSGRVGPPGPDSRQLSEPPAVADPPTRRMADAIAIAIGAMADARLPGRAIKLFAAGALVVFGLILVAGGLGWL